MVEVEETIHHGDTYNTRVITVDLDDIEAVVKMLNTCSYLRLPDPNFGKGAVLVSRSYDEIVAQRQADAAKIAKKLATKKGEAEIGFVRYEVIK